MTENRPRVLVLGSYPAVNPRHGGQIRLSEIIAAYQRSGHEVISVNCFVANAFYLQGLSGPHDFPIPAHFLSEYRGLRAPFIEDLACGEKVINDAQLMSRIKRAVGQGIDLIHLEQPWLLPVAKRLMDLQHRPTPLVYGSQNIEAPLKRAILEQFGIHESDQILDAVHALERQAAMDADVVLAVTIQDAELLRQWVRPGVPVLLAANGIKPWTADPSLLQQWRSKVGKGPFAIYAASGHPPNIKGFCESFGESMAGLAPDQKVVLVGGVSDQLGDHPWFGRWAALNPRRVLRLGVLPQADLDALRQLAHTYVVPITSGGGSNLKTAEALFSGRHVVATPMAMRGFEQFSDLPGVEIVNPGPDFGRAVSTSLGAVLPENDAASAARRAMLTWEHSLADMVRTMSKISKRVSDQ